MKEITNDDFGMQELTTGEIDDVSGGILCVIVVAAAVVYGVGYAIYRAVK